MGSKTENNIGLHFSRQTFFSSGNSHIKERKKKEKALQADVSCLKFTEPCRLARVGCGVPYNYLLMRTKAFSLGGLQKGLPGEPCKAVHRCDSDLIPRTAWADFPSNTSICLGQELPSAGLNLSSPPGQQL